MRTPRGTGKRRTLRRADFEALRDDLRAKAGLLDFAVQERAPWATDTSSLASARAYRDAADEIDKLLQGGTFPMVNRRGEPV